MDVTELVDEITDATNTELSRLGSSKSLFADTDGELEPETVLAAMADAANYAAETFEAWTREHDTTTVAEAAHDRVSEQYDRIEAELDGHEPGDPPAVVAALPEGSDPHERLGAIVGWSLVAERKASQATGYFTGQADPGTASLFRDFGEDYETIRSTALDGLEMVSPDNLDQAREAAIATIEAAYDEYVECLEAQGVNPKPVC